MLGIFCRLMKLFLSFFCECFFVDCLSVFYPIVCVNLQNRISPAECNIRVFRDKRQIEIRLSVNLSFFSLFYNRVIQVRANSTMASLFHNQASSSSTTTELMIKKRKVLKGVNKRLELEKKTKQTTTIKIVKVYSCFSPTNLELWSNEPIQDFANPLSTNRANKDLAVLVSACWINAESGDEKHRLVVAIPINSSRCH